MAIHPVDKHVGERIRARRRDLKISQQMLGEKLGLTFQQIQKYERGSNRVSASKLFEAAQVLGVPVEYFYAGLEDGETPSAVMVADPLAGLDADQRKAVQNLIKSLAKNRLA